jgi:hypothetical protein
VRSFAIHALRRPALILVLIAGFAVFACAAAPEPSATSASVYGDLLRKHQPTDLEVLRMRSDKARQRLWVLTTENVHVYDLQARTLLRRIALPNWSVADFAYACPPDMILDNRGAAFISNNVQPRLFEIEPNLRAHERELVVVSRRRSEVGLGSLEIAPDGMLFAMSATGGTVFRIELTRGIAAEVTISDTAHAALTASTARRFPPDCPRPSMRVRDMHLRRVVGGQAAKN